MDYWAETTLHTAAGWACGRRELPRRELARLVEDPDLLLWRYLHRPVKIDHTSLIVEAELPLGGRRVRVACKRYCPKNWWKSLLQLFRSSRARRSWRLARLLLDRGIPTARPVALWEPRRRFLRKRSYLATEWIEGAGNLHVYAWQLAHCPVEERFGRAARCAESLGRLVGRMHAAGIVNRDLKGANLLVVEQEDLPLTYLVDPDGSRAVRQVSASQRGSDLARLAVALEAHRWVGRSICCRFLRAYAAEFPPGEIAWKSLWHDVARRTRRVVHRLRRRGEEVL